MYKLVEISIDGFWGKYHARCGFNQDVNIIIGKNGTGKTTFMNILNAVLSVDTVALLDNDFTEVVIRLGFDGSSRTIKVTKSEDMPFTAVRYHIAQRKFALPLIGEDLRSASLYRRRAAEAAQKIKDELSGIVSLASLSVYRFRSNTDPDAQDRGTYRKVLGPVDMRLNELMHSLSNYQLSLAQRSRNISVDLQRDVLMSLLYKNEANQVGYALDFDADQEKQNLVAAYKQLGIYGSSINKRIAEHVSSIESTVQEIKAAIKRQEKSFEHVDFAPLEASKRAHKVFDMSLEAEKKIKSVYSQVDLFLAILKEFIEGKEFGFESGELVVKSPSSIPISKLSSGEKQLLIIFAEALLQRQEPYIFLADEPELSLHIAWQRKIIPAIKKLNPNAQVLVATHSPEIAGKYRGCMVDMEDILHVGN
ncbi:ATP-binding protein [Pseudomonas sp. 2(2015)]|uniref:AAA family ATPase n=1 Tax=Pseudomonas sp. 2(2015) TaxID=1619950 RepID=UPI0005EB348E|nr:ATP-binding protein [Pseudomonas sp. 2(2015)]KJK17137.1 ABC transporter ATPase [Pseudomonas sp. 2(2015)]